MKRQNTCIPLLLTVIFLTGCRLLPLSATTPRAATQPVVESAVVSSETPIDPAPTSTDFPYSQLFDLPWDDRSPFESSLIETSAHWAREFPDASQYRLELTIPQGYETLQGKEEVLYTNQETLPLDEIFFRLFPNISGGSSVVSDILVNGSAVHISYESQDSAFRVSLPAPLQPGEKVLFEMNFTLEIPREMGGNYGLFGYFNNVLVLDLFYPTIPVYDAAGWYSEVPSENGDFSYYDASFYLVRVIAPSELVLAASGVEIERLEVEDNQVVTFALGPSRDFILAGSELYSVVSDSIGETRINSYSLPGFEEGQKYALQVAMDAFQSFNTRISVYDYCEFDVVPTPMLAGGVEYPGVTWVNMDFYNLSETISGLPASEMLEMVVAHEVGHQWFYNAVGNDQVSEPWLDEALVQYITGLYLKDLHGQPGYLSAKSTWNYRWNRIDRAFIPIGLPSGDYEGYDYVAVVYGRGPFFFEEVSREIGEDTFDTFLMNYAATYHWKIATGFDLKQSLEDTCSCDLSALFKEWVYPQE